MLRAGFEIAYEASSQVLLGFLATAAVLFSAVSVPSLAAAILSSSSASVPVPAVSDKSSQTVLGCQLASHPQVA